MNKIQYNHKLLKLKKKETSAFWHHCLFLKMADRFLYDQSFSSV